MAERTRARALLEAGARLSAHSGAGNRFVLADALGAPLLAELARAARTLCALPLVEGLRADGLLVLRPAAGDAAARFEVFNRDGSRAAACGNGLRCAAQALFARGHAPGPRARLETDAGERAVELLALGRERGPLGGQARVRVGMGRALGRELAHPLPAAWRELRARAFDLGNPHCVVRVEDERAAPVAELGAALQTHPDFPGGVNVGFLARRAGAWRLRVYERGVGETLACGSGACAAAAAALDERGAASGRVALALPGGLLEVERAADGALLLTGPARETAGPARFRADLERALRASSRAGG